MNRIIVEYGWTNFKIRQSFNPDSLKLAICFAQVVMSQGAKWAHITRG